MDPTSTLETVTPDRARGWLEGNTHNRTLRWATVQQYARDMRNGDWRLTGDPVQFSTDGTVHDGQHRLHAVIESGTTVRMFVCRGLEPSTQQYIDQGIARRPGDALALSGYANSALLGAAARIGVQYDTGTLLGDNSVKTSHAEIIQWVEEHPDMAECVKTMSTRVSRIPLAPSVSIYCYYRFCGVNEADAIEFMDALASGANLPAHSPMLVLHDKLTRLAINRKKLSHQESLAVVFRAWNAYRDGRPVTRLQVPTKPIRDLPALR